MNPPTPTDEKKAAKPADRMVRVQNVCTRNIIEDGKSYKPGDVFELTEQRASQYAQRVRTVPTDKHIVKLPQRRFR